MRKHKCLAIDCVVQVGYTLLMCPRHWRMVPYPIQRRVWIAWEARQRGEPGALRLWTVAAADAVAAVHAAELAAAAPSQARPDTTQGGA